MPPWPDIFKPEGLATEVLSLRVQGQIPIEQRPLNGVCYPAGNIPCFPFQQQPDRERPRRIVRVQSRLEPEVRQVRFRFCVEEHSTENPAEPEEILILDPRRAAALVDLHAQPVACLPNIGREVKV